MQGGDGPRPACRVVASARYLAAFQPKQVPHFFTDILVIGSGLAGLRAALGVDQKLSVLVVTKDELHSSNSDRAQGGVAAVLGADDCFEDHVADTLIAGGALCAPEVVRYVVQEAPRRVIELIEWGAKFDQNGSRLALTREGGHRRNRIVHAHGDATGREIIRALTQRVFQAAIGWELQNMLMVASLIIEAASLRTETRGGHVRTDYPALDDEHWTRHITFCHGGDRSRQPCQENTVESRSGRLTEPDSRPMPRAGLADR